MKNSQQFAGKKFLALDYGLSRVGHSQYWVGHDPLILPSGEIQVSSQQQLIEDVVTLCREMEIDCIVLGLPTHVDGKWSAMTQKVVNFCNQLKIALPQIAFYQQSECLSSFEATQRMESFALQSKNQLRKKKSKKKKDRNIDAMAASIILEDFMEADQALPL